MLCLFCRQATRVVARLSVKPMVRETIRKIRFYRIGETVARIYLRGFTIVAEPSLIATISNPNFLYSLNA
jgi:hypothetical protein